MFNKMILRSLLFLLPPEISHSLIIMALKKMYFFKKPIDLPRSLNVNFFGSKLRSPVGLAAGFDKNAEVIRSMFSFGFGFVEVGTVTKYPQCGNKKPRIFRLIKDEGIINRLGFNNKGIDFFLKQIDKTKLNDCIFGINIAKNSTSKDQISDYVDLLKIVYGKSSYIVLNISSPNTPNLRNLHNQKELSILLRSITLTRKLIDDSESIPIMLKISPDINQQTKENVAELVLKYKINGLIVSNTTISKSSYYYNESGGLSGRPLFQLSTKLLSEMYKLTKNRILLIGCGGISSGVDAYEKIKVGASLVQLYTALVYQGYQVVNKINLELAELIRKDGFSNVTEAVGCIH